MCSKFRHTLALILLTALGCTNLCSSADASSIKHMEFSAIPPKQPVEIYGSPWIIFADGAIDENTASDFLRFMQHNKIPEKSLLYLNSLGGNLLGGIGFGREIRRLGITTEVGIRDRNGKPMVGGCYSACALSFLGGIFRYIPQGSAFGVHRFSSGRHSDEDLDVAQVVSASIIQYIRDMSVDVGLFNIMTSVGPDNIIVLSQDELVRYGVVNSGHERTFWSIESAGTGLYLKGERKTYHGVNKFIILCNSMAPRVLLAIFEAEGREDDIMNIRNYSLIVDGVFVSLSNNLLLRQIVSGGIVNAFFSLDESKLAMIGRASTVGIAFQPVADREIFLGFQGMDFRDGAKKLPGFLSTCR